MKFMKNPYINAAVITAISAFYAVVFIITSRHVEFERMLSHSQTLNSAFWNGWTIFLREGNQKYIGYAYIVAAVCILMMSLVRKKNYDEYQAGILATSFVITGILLLIMFPIALLLVMSDSNYAVETLVFLVTAHWSVFLAVNLGLLLRWGRG